jgi:hypothetical protein
MDSADESFLQHQFYHAHFAIAEADIERWICQRRYHWHTFQMSILELISDRQVNDRFNFSAIRKHTTGFWKQCDKWPSAWE